MGCIGCHNIDQPQTDTNKGPVAPNLANLYEVAGTTVPGEDAVTYTHTSIVNPTAYTEPGYNPVMPANFSDACRKKRSTAWSSGSWTRIARSKGSGLTPSAEPQAERRGG